MTLNILLDMNLSPRWVERLEARGLSVVRWSSVGEPTARDNESMAWARANQHMVFAHDLDFGTILALSHEAGPSVLQVRATRFPAPSDSFALTESRSRQRTRPLANPAAWMGISCGSFPLDGLGAQPRATKLEQVIWLAMPCAQTK